VRVLLIVSVYIVHRVIAFRRK